MTKYLDMKNSMYVQIMSPAMQSEFILSCNGEKRETRGDASSSISMLSNMNALVQCFLTFSNSCTTFFLKKLNGPLLLIHINCGLI